MPISQYDKDSVGEILSGHGDWFTANLMRVICTADSSNKARLYKEFPEEVEAVHQFQTGKTFLDSKMEIEKANAEFRKKKEVT